MRISLLVLALLLLPGRVLGSPDGGVSEDSARVSAIIVEAAKAPKCPPASRPDKAERIAAWVLAGINAIGAGVAATIAAMKGQP